MNKSRRKFLGKAPAVVIGAGVGAASVETVMASPSNWPPDWPQGTRPLLDFIIAGQRRINGRLFAANQIMLEVLETIIPHLPVHHAAALAKLAEAGGYIDGVPGEPPACELPPGYGGGYGGGD